MKMAVSALAVVLTLALFGASKSEAPTAEQLAARKAKLKAEAYARTGGPVEKAGVYRGRIVILDAQDVADFRDELLPAIERTLKLARMSVDVVYVKAARDDYEKMKKANAAEFALIVIADDAAVATMIAPEERYAVVNVKKYGRGFKSIKERKTLYDSRCAKAVLKAFSLLCGGGSSRFEGNLPSTAKMESLDTVNCSLPIDMIDRYRKYLVAAGIPQRVLATYRHACEQGWAPAPTNEIQKAIWEKVHQSPSAPIVIKPETKQAK